MATTITDVDNIWYHKGVEQDGGYRRLGYYQGSYVIRYKFTTPAEGASKISITKRSLSSYENSVGSNENIMFFITRDPESHIGACYVEGSTNNPETDGIFQVSKGTETNYAESVITGSVEKNLLPNTDYYLYLFPAYSSYGFYLVYGSANITITLEGSAGVVRIKEGDRELIAVPMVKEDGELVQLAATVKSGENLNYCV